MPRKSRDVAIRNPPFIDGEYLIDGQEAADMLLISRERLLERTSDNPNTRKRGGAFIPSYKIAGRRWFKPSEIKKLLEPNGTSVDMEDMSWI